VSSGRARKARPRHVVPGTVRLLIDGHTDLHPAETRDIRATVTVPALALLDPDPAGAVATVEGIGPIPFDRARELCGGAKDWMRVRRHHDLDIPHRPHLPSRT
jgi:hypothetical protein